MIFDGDFIARLRKKEEKAFTELYRRTGLKVYNFILKRIGKDADAAEDVLSEVFAAAVCYSTTLTPFHDVEAWLIRIARSKVADYYRAHKRETDWRTNKPVEELAVEKGPGLDPAADLIDRSDIAVVGEAFTALKPTDQEVLTLMYVEGQSVKDIACALARSEKSIEALLYRARIKLESKITNCKKKAGKMGRGMHEP